MSGFMTDEQIDDYKAALTRERESYVMKASIAEDDGDDVAKRKWDKAVSEVDAELERTDGYSSKESSGELDGDEDPDAEKPKKKRGRSN